MKTHDFDIKSLILLLYCTKDKILTRLRKAIIWLIIDTYSLYTSIRLLVLLSTLDLSYVKEIQ